jgi:hypothetical protein
MIATLADFVSPPLLFPALEDGIANEVPAIHSTLLERFGGHTSKNGVRHNRPEPRFAA